MKIDTKLHSLEEEQQTLQHHLSRQGPVGFAPPPPPPPPPPPMPMEQPALLQLKPQKSVLPVELEENAPPVTQLLQVAEW